MTQIRILFVCPGNAYRSVLALGAMRHLIAGEDRLDGFLLDAAGASAAQTPPALDAPLLGAAHRNQISLDDHRARRVEPCDFKSFDLLLAMDPASKACLVASAPPGTAQKVHQLLDFAPWIGMAEFPITDGLDADSCDDMIDLLLLALRGLLEVIDQSKRDFAVALAPRARLKVASGT